MKKEKTTRRNRRAASRERLSEAERREISMQYETSAAAFDLALRLAGRKIEEPPKKKARRS